MKKEYADFLAVTCCSACGQPMPEIRCGVRMSKLKARLFDAVKRSASGGITSRDLTEIVYPEGASQVLIRNHIAQINDKLAGTDWRIRGTRGSHSVYRLVRERSQ